MLFFLNMCYKSVLVYLKAKKKSVTAVYRYNIILCLRNKQADVTETKCSFGERCNKCSGEPQKKMCKREIVERGN